MVYTKYSLTAISGNRNFQLDCLNQNPSQMRCKCRLETHQIKMTTRSKIFGKEDQSKFSQLFLTCN